MCCAILAVSHTSSGNIDEQSTIVTTDKWTEVLHLDAFAGVDAGKHGDSSAKQQPAIRALHAAWPAVEHREAHIPGRNSLLWSEPPASPDMHHVSPEKGSALIFYGCAQTDGVLRPLDNAGDHDGLTVSHEGRRLVPSAACTRQL